jgi:hypothetical protein
VDLVPAITVNILVSKVGRVAGSTEEDVVLADLGSKNSSIRLSNRVILVGSLIKVPFGEANIGL